MVGDKHRENHTPEGGSGSIMAQLLYLPSALQVLSKGLTLVIGFALHSDSKSTCTTTPQTVTYHNVPLRAQVYFLPHLTPQALYTCMHHKVTIVSPYTPR